MLFLGDDWAEAHHDIELQDDQGRRLVRRRLPEGVDGIAALHALVADHLPDDADPAEVAIGIETDRGPWVQALVAAGYTVYAVNPLQVARYRERHGTSGAKSDPGDAHVLAELVRTDRAHHRPVAGDSELAEGVKVLARSHQSLIWARQRQVNLLRSTLREFYPAALAAFGTDLADRDALAVLHLAPTPGQGRELAVGQVRDALRAAGRQRNLDRTATRIVTALRTEQLAARPLVTAAYGTTVHALVAVIAELSRQVARLDEQVNESFGQHPDAEIYRSQPGLGAILAARVLAEFGDDAERYADAKSRKNYSGMSPITRACGTRRVVLARYARNRRLADALYLQAFSALTASPGARRYYDAHRSRGATHHQACAPSPTGSSASSTAACATTPPTTRPPHGRPGRSTTTAQAELLDNLRPWDVSAVGWVPVTRPRVRASDGSGELSLPSYEAFTSRELLGRLALGRMLGGLSTRRYRLGWSRSVRRWPRP